MKPQSTSEDFNLLEKQLNSLHQINIMRDPVRTKNNRAAFLSEVEKLNVSKQVFPRLTLQNQIINFFNSGKEKLKMSPALVSLIAALLVFFGGSGAGIVAAQNSLPNDFLYPVKTTTEDIQMAITNQPEEKFTLAMDLSQIRLDELTNSIKNGDIPEEAFFTRLDDLLMTSFKLASETSAENSGSLLNLRIRLQEQVRLMEQIQPGNNQEASAVVTRTQSMLKSHIKFVDDWISANKNQSPAMLNPDSAQEMNRNSNQETNQNSNQEMNQNSNQEMNQNSNQEMNQNSNQEMNQNSNQDTNQNSEQETNQTINQIGNQAQDNGNGNNLTPTVIPKNVGNQNSGSNSGGGGGGGNGKR